MKRINWKFFSPDDNILNYILKEQSIYENPRRTYKKLTFVYKSGKTRDYDTKNKPTKRDK